MIDYEKLKIAHNLVLSTASYYFQISMSIETRILLCNDELGEEIEISSLDELINKLKRLISAKQSPTELWYLSVDNVYPVCKKVNRGDYYLYLYENYPQALGKNIYTSKESLIDDQIKYWQSKKDVQKIIDEDCKHEK